MKKIIIFDLDGTILDTIIDLTNAVNYAMQMCNYPTHTSDEVKCMVGNGIKNLIKRAMPQGYLEDAFIEFFSYFKSYYEEHTYDYTKPYDGILEVLERLKSEGYLLAIASNKADFAVKKLSRHFFGNLFYASLGAKEGFALKPNKAIIDEILNMSDSEYQAIYVGDSEVDILTASNAGIPCISVTWGFREEEALRNNGATVIARTPEELYEKINSNNI